MNSVNIPLHQPYFDSHILDYLQQVFDSGKLSGDGSVCKSVEQQLRQLFGAKNVLLTTSCTHALEMAMMALELKPGDEVIVPSFTFTSTANAILRAGGKPVFCDINERTQTIDVNDFQRRITTRTKAVIPVHYAGVSAEMDDIMRIARSNGCVVVEDAAQGVNAKYKGKFLGTIGDIGAYSFHDTKNYVSGEGGAFITENDSYTRKGEIIREKGTNRANFLRGEVDKYTWVDLGSSFVLSEILAAVLKYQLDNLAYIQQERKRVHFSYVDGLRELETKGRLRLPVIPEYCESNYHIFYVLLGNEEERTYVMKRLKEFGVGSAFHYVPLHTSPFARGSLGTKDLRLPVTESIYGRLLRLPIYPHLEEERVQFVVEKIKQILR